MTSLAASFTQPRRRITPHLRRVHSGGGGASRRRSRTLVDAGDRLQFDPVFVLTALLLAAALVLGGSSQGNVLQLGLLELFSLPVVGAAIHRLRAGGRLGGLRIPLLLMGLVAAVPLVQLIPLPLEVWRNLPGREALAAGLLAAGVQPGWMAMTLTPQSTLDSALALIVPFAVFLGVCACSEAQRRTLVVLIVAGGVASLLLGLVQVADGSDSALRLYETTNRGSAVGFFANRNHQAVFLLLALPLVAGWMRGGVSVDGRGLAATAAMLGLLLVVLVGVAVTRSRAGLILTAPALAGALLVMGRSVKGRRYKAAFGAVGVLSILMFAAVLLFLPPTVKARFAPPLEEDFRVTIWNNTSAAADHYAPLGSGVGSFVRVYPAFEEREEMQRAFVNHAHNDYLELWMEAGWASGLVGLALAAWLAWRTFACWRANGSGLRLARGASMAVLLLLAHSAVDYPLRTPAMAAVLAVCLALLELGARNGVVKSLSGSKSWPFPSKG